MGFTTGAATGGQGDQRGPAVPGESPLPRVLIVSAADEAFAPLLRGLLDSLAQWRQAQPPPYTALACFDLGLAPATRAWLETQVEHVATPGWDLPVDPLLRAREPQLRALTVRPFLPRHFPGYDVYIWLDADTWVQERGALDALAGAAWAGALAATPETDPAYQQHEGAINWRINRAQACFGAAGAQRARNGPYFNAGVFALRADAPHWAAWAAWFEAELRNTQGRLCCDQTALNQMLWLDGLAVRPLPAGCNWVCNLTAPEFDPRTGKFHLPGLPGSPVGIMHLSGENKQRYFSAAAGPHAATCDLHFGAPRPMAGAVAAPRFPASFPASLPATNGAHLPRYLAETAGLLCAAAVLGVVATSSTACGIGLASGTATWCSFLFWTVGTVIATPIALLVGLPGSYLFRKLGWRRWWQFSLAGLLAAVPIWVELAVPFSSARWHAAGFFDSLITLGTGAVAGLAYWWWTVRPAKIRAL